MAATTFKCPKCYNYTTPWLFAFSSHLRKCRRQLPVQSFCKSDLDSYKCEHCKFETSLRVDYHNHINSNNCVDPVNKVSRKEFKCNRCIFSTFSKYFLAAHRSEVVCWSRMTKDGNIQCKVCGRILRSRGGLKLHVMHLHSGFVNISRKLFKCPHCPYISNAGNKVEMHTIRKHTDPNQIKWFKCKHCSYRAKGKKEFTSHVFTRHSQTKRVSCDQCSYKAKNIYTLRNHIKFLHSTTLKLFKCNFCPYIAKRGQNLKDHINARHLDPSQVKWFPCLLCPYKAKTKHHLTKHMRNIHLPANKVEWFKCDQCNHKSKYKNNLEKHMKLHEPTKEEFSCVECTYKTHRKESLRLHWQALHSNNWYQCAHCDYKIRNKYAMKKHYLRNHTDPDSIMWHECP